MLAELRRIMQKELPGMIRDPSTPWKTLDVLYEKPRVERVWVQHGANRLYLHRIHPCEHPYRHHHPWPSAIHVLSGGYHMEIGEGDLMSSTLALLDVRAGSGYEMLDRHGWHSVAPYDVPSLSLMLTGVPWEDQALPPADLSANRPLNDAVKAEICREVLGFL